MSESDARPRSDESPRIAMVTGATSAIGKAIAAGIAAHPGYHVVLTCRDRARAEAAATGLRRATGNRQVSCEIVDLSLRQSIRELAARWSGPLHVLVNNAADTPRQRRETADGLEVQFATNIMGYFWLTREFEAVLARSAPARVVNVASYWAGDLDIDDLQFRRRRYDNDTAYRQSKQANRMLTVAFAERLASSGISVNACHPGDVNSRLSNSLGFGGHESPQTGAATPVWLAVGDQEHGPPPVTGKYFEHKREKDCRFGRDRAAVEALYAACSDHAR